VLFSAYAQRQIFGAAVHASRLSLCLSLLLHLPLAVKQRIRAIKNIGKITKAMKMVAASKMKNAQIAVESSRGSVDPFIRLFGDHPGGPARGREEGEPAGRQGLPETAFEREGSPCSLPTACPSSELPLSLPCLRAAVTAPKTATVAVTSDKGLCGGLNSNITKYTRMLLRLNEPSGRGKCLLVHTRGLLSRPAPCETHSPPPVPFLHDPALQVRWRVSSQ